MTDDDTKISKHAFNFVKLNQIDTKGEGKTIDVVGVILSCSEASAIKLKSGAEKDKRDYMIVDNSAPAGVKIQITLWGIPAKKYSFEEGTVVAFKGLKVTTFKGLTLNGGDYSGVYTSKDIKIKQEPELIRWYKSAKNGIVDARSLTIIEEAEKKGVAANVKLIKEVQNCAEEDLRLDPNTRYYVNCHVEMIKNDPKMLYMACPKCKKKMIEEPASYDHWNCEK